MCQTQGEESSEIQSKPDQKFAAFECGIGGFVDWRIVQWRSGDVGIGTMWSRGCSGRDMGGGGFVLIRGNAASCWRDCIDQRRNAASCSRAHGPRPCSRSCWVCPCG